MSLKKTVAVLLAAACLLSCAVFAVADGELAYGAATVNASSLNIRSGPSTDSTKLGSIPRNERLVILDKGDGTWYHINYQGIEGYVHSDYLKDVLTVENFSASGEVTGDGVRLRSKPSTEGKNLGAYPKGTKVVLTGINNGWYKLNIDGTIGYMRSDYVKITGPASAVSNPSTGTNTPGSGSNEGTSAPINVTVGEGEASEKGQKIVDLALKFVGYDYVYGAESPEDGFDCSGLTWYCYGQFGYKLERRASMQQKKNGTTVSKSKLKVGDLVFFSSNGESVTHVGIYIGDGKFVHAANSTAGVIISDLNSAYYTKCWFGAKRIV